MHTTMPSRRQQARASPRKTLSEMEELGGLLASAIVADKTLSAGLLGDEQVRAIVTVKDTKRFKAAQCDAQANYTIAAVVMKNWGSNIEACR